LYEVFLRPNWTTGRAYCYKALEFHSNAMMSVAITGRTYCYKVLDILSNTMMSVVQQVGHTAKKP